MSTLDFIMAFEGGEVSEDQLVEGFAALVRDGSAWTLQGTYGRMAQHLIDAGYIQPDGSGYLRPSDGETVEVQG